MTTGVATARPVSADAGSVVLPAGGLDVAGALAFLRARAVPGLEELAGEAYRRWVPLPGGSAVIELTLAGDDVVVSAPADLAAAVQLVRHLLDLDTDPAPVDAALGRDAALRDAVRRVPGIRVPGAVDGTELAVRAIIGQQISVAGARTVVGRLVAAYGRPLDVPVGAVTRAFPAAEVLAALDPADLPMPRRRGATLIEVCRRLAAGELSLDPAVAADAAARAATRAALLDIPGIGPWTADYLLMRVLHEPDAFLPTDLGVRVGLERASLPTDARTAAERAERWQPWRSYATMHLWRLATTDPSEAPS